MILSLTMYLCLKYIHKNIERRITVESLYVRITVEFFIQGDTRKLLNIDCYRKELSLIEQN